MEWSEEWNWRISTRSTRREDNIFLYGIYTHGVPKKINVENMIIFLFEFPFHKYILLHFISLFILNMKLSTRT